MSSSVTAVYSCPLCYREETKHLVHQTRKGRRYWLCPDCRLIFVDPTARPDRQREHDIYRQHSNSPAHSGYVALLQRIIEPALPFLNPSMHGLDYGCGPGPTLSVLLKEAGLRCAIYDPMFFPEWPSGPFDFIFATECFEHFHTPAREIKRLNSLLNPGGYLFVMTDLWHESLELRTWNYLTDPTHVSFFHLDTFTHICHEYGFKLMNCDGKRIVMLQKRKQPA